MNDSFLKKLNEIILSVEGVQKNNINPYFNSKYADLNSVLDIVKRKCKDVGLIFIQIPECENDVQYLRTTIADYDGNKIEGRIRLLKTDDMQKIGSALTYARRYSLVCMLGIESEDDDGNRSSSIGLYDEIKRSFMNASSESELKASAEKYRSSLSEMSLSYKKDIVDLYKNRMNSFNNSKGE